MNAEKSKISKQQDEVKEKIVKAEEINKKLREQGELEVSFNTLLGEKDAYVKKEILLQKSRKALPIYEIEKTYLRGKTCYNK